MSPGHVERTIDATTIEEGWPPCPLGKALGQGRIARQPRRSMSGVEQSFGRQVVRAEPSETEFRVGERHSRCRATVRNRSDHLHVSHDGLPRRYVHQLLPVRDRHHRLSDASHAKRWLNIEDGTIATVVDGEPKVLTFGELDLDRHPPGIPAFGVEPLLALAPPVIALADR